MSAAYTALPTSPSSPTRELRSLSIEDGNALGLSSDDEAPKDDEGEVDEAAVVVPGEDTITSFVYTLVFIASISGLLFGYDTGVISGTLVAIGTDLGSRLTNGQKQSITAATTLGALIGGAGAGVLSDTRGRKGVLALANVVFVLGSLLQAAAHRVGVMVAGRLIVGLGVGLASCVAPLYIGELAPTRLRGRLVTANAVAVTLGQVVAYGIGALFAKSSGGWRWMVGLGAVPAFVQLACLGFLPESPRILLLRGDTPAVTSVLEKIYPLATTGDVSRKVAIMGAAVRQSEAAAQEPWRVRLASLLRVGTHRRALIIGCGLQALQQLCGFNTLMYYSASIFEALGFKNATATGMLVAIVNWAFTVVALKVVDPFGRRRTLLYTVPIMVVALFCAALFFYYLTIPTGGVLIPGTEYSRPLAICVLTSMLLFVAAYATGLGNIPWQQGELFRLEVRGIGSSIATATNWSSNLLVAATFLSLMDAASPAGAFSIYALVCMAGWVFVWALYPETSGLSLEEVYEVFEDDFGVSKSEAMRAAKAERRVEAEWRIVGGEE